MYSRRKCLTVEGTIAELHLDPLLNISDSESSDMEAADSNLLTKSVWKISLSCLGASSDNEPSTTDRNDSEISEQSDIETVDRWSKSDKTPNVEVFVGNPGVSVNVEDPTDIAQFVSTVIGDDLIQLFTRQSNLYHRQKVDKWKISPRSLKWTDITK
jgi:hypothetical protein